MAADLFRLIYTGDPVAPERRRRQWLGMGESMVVAGIALVAQCDPGWDPHIEIRSPDGDVGVSPIMPMTFSSAGPYAVVPRALSYSPHGKVTAVLLETQYTGTNKPGWEKQTNEDDCNAHLHEIPDSR